MQKEEFSLPVYSTEDYSIFSVLTGNRDIYPRHVRRLVRVLQNNPEFTKANPIKVNKNLEVIDGQHRLEAHRKYAERGEGAPSIYYIVQEGGLEEAKALNAGSKTWTARDYARAYAVSGNPHYIKYEELAAKFPEMSHNLLTRYLGGSDAAIRAFKYGEFTVKDAKEAERQLKMLEEAGPSYKMWPSQAFGIAFHRLVNNRQYNHARMMEQIGKFRDALDSLPNRAAELIIALNMVYNFRTPQKVDLLEE